MPDSNDIVFNNYGLDLVTLFTRGLTALFSGEINPDGIMGWLASVWEVYSIIAFLLSFLFILGIIYSYIRFNQLSEIENNRLLEMERMWEEVYGDKAGHSDWQQIQRHIGSENPNDWRLAIIEADIMLDRTLKDAGYAGNSVGERLKSASPLQFTTLQDAWDAHVVRNKIAHEGSDFLLTHRVAKEVIVKYQRVFSEFGVL